MSLLILNKGHICEQCGQAFYKRSAMIRHQNATCASKKIKLNHDCKECGEVFESYGKLNRYVDNRRIL